MAIRLFRHSVRLALTVAISACALVSLYALSTEYKTTYLSFNTPIQLPGVGLAPGTYVFELADPFDNPRIVRVMSRDRSTVYFMAFTEMFERPRGLKPDVFVSFGEAAVGDPLPIAAWYPPRESLGRRFIYRHGNR
jgi:hypothetical protein